MKPQNPPAPRRNQAQFGERRSLDFQTRSQADPTLDLRPYGTNDVVKPSEYVIDLSGDEAYLSYDDSL
jgi:hypothetical protein